MKELLYIPNGKYVRFVELGGNIPLEHLIKYYRNSGNLEYVSPEAVICGLCSRKWNPDVYASAEIDNSKILQPCEFEVVEV